VTSGAGRKLKMGEGHTSCTHFFGSTSTISRFGE